MYGLEKKTGRGRDHDRFLSPSFSSTLLDQIYRSIDDGDSKTGETKFYTETTSTTVNNKKQTTDRKTSHQRGRVVDHDQDDVLFFSSTSISSDSSCGGFSSSDTDSVSLSRASSCLAPPRPKPVRTSASASFRLEKEKQGTTRVFDGFCPAKQGTAVLGDGEKAVLVNNKNKSRALKIYNNLKKVKQPISPGGKLTSFLNSLFAQTVNEDGNKKHKKKKSTKGGTCKEEHVIINAERKVAKAGGASSSTCSSASSFSRSCLSKTSKTTSFSSSQRDIRGSCNVVGNNRTVRFCPVEEKELIKSRVAREAAAREFLKKNDLVLKDLPIRTKMNHNHEDDDDAASDASSDLFELDHLDVLGSGRYCEELPVYETTHVSTNRAIAKGLIV